MDWTTYLRFVVALIFVLGLIGLVAWLGRRTGFTARATPNGGSGRRLAVVEVTPVDAKRRLVLVRRDDTEHLILLGGSAETVVERGIVTPDHESREHHTANSVQQTS